MTVGFLLPSSYDPKSSIWRKVLMQASELRKLGVRALIFSFSGERTEAEEHHIHIPLDGTKSKERKLRELIDLMIEAGVNLVYLRRELWHPAYGRMMRAIPTVAEINTMEGAEFKLTMSFPRRVYASLTASCWRRYPAGYVSVTQELAANLPARKPRAVVANGIPGPVQTPALHQERPHLFFSCTGTYQWHGVDEYISMARLFPEWAFSFVGDFPEELRLRVPPNLTIHGKLPAAQADELLATASIGVGTLALHRKRMEEACPLKLRSYLAYGLPSIIAYKDTDFSRDFNFICQLKNAEGSVTAEREKIGNFVNANYARRVPWKDVSFASEQEKARRRFEFFSEVLEKGDGNVSQ